jgi:hypothetical protein
MEMDGKEEKAYDEYLKEMKKTPKGKRYKIFERYAPLLFPGIKDTSSRLYWKINGEGRNHDGMVEFFESRESLEGKAVVPGRPVAFRKLLGKETRKLILKNLPKRCSNCGFHRFFGVRIRFYSVNDTIDLFCPNCRKARKVCGDR